MATWFTSDHHFWHQNILRFCPGRPYATIEDMNEMLIVEWNKLIAPEDTVYYLGDFSMAFRPVETYPQRLNGKKILIPGNHDFCHPAHKKGKKDQAKWEKKYLESGFSEIHLHYKLSIEELGITVNLSHMPYKNMEPGEHGLKYEKYRPEYDPNTWLLHGHVHQHWQIKGNMINVGIDVWDMKPVSLGQIIELIKKGPSNPKYQ